MLKSNLSVGRKAVLRHSAFVGIRGMTSGFRGASRAIQLMHTVSAATRQLGDSDSWNPGLDCRSPKGCCRADEGAVFQIRHFVTTHLRKNLSAHHRSSVTT
jgi:hypothetical protein